MQKVVVYYKDVKLGEMQFLSKNYIYKANKKGAEIVKNILTEDKFLKFFEDKLSTEPPFTLFDFYTSKQLFTAIKQSKITDDDTDFEIFYKLASNNHPKNELHLEIN